MSFDVAADRYGRFMGRYSEPLAHAFADAADLRDGAQVLDVGCGPGALTGVLVDRLGAANVVGADPSLAFVEAARARFPDVRIEQAGAEQLPFPDDAYDAALAQLVVHFMTDPVAGLREMARVTRPGGTIAACVWDFAGEAGPLSLFWRVVGELDPGAHNESGLAGARQGHLVELCTEAGLHAAVESRISVTVPYASAEEWWEPYTYGVGPAGDYVAGLTDEAREVLKARCLEQLPAAPFTVDAFAWCVTAKSP